MFTLFNLSRICIVGLVILLFLSGCASQIRLSDYTPFAEDDPRKYDTLYLRGVFNWWEASPDYRFAIVPDGNYVVAVELIADGQPYDFRVANSIYSDDHNCGGLTENSVLSLSNTFILHCNAASFNLRYTPQESGKYLFTLIPGDKPKLVISKI